MIIEDKIRYQEAGRKFSARPCPTANDLAQFPVGRIPLVPRENSLPPRFSRIGRISRPISFLGKRRCERESLQLKSPNSVIKTRSKFMKTNDSDTAKSPKNAKTRFTNPPVFWRLDPHFFPNFSPPLASVLPPMLQKNCNWSRPLLTGTAPQTEFDLTYRKQTTEKFLTGARTHIRKTRFCAKMSKETNEKTSEMKALR